MAEQNAGEHGSTEQRTGRHAVPDDAPDTTTNATTEGAATEGAATEGAATEGAATEGAATEGAATEGAATDGAATGGAATTTTTPAEAPTQQVAGDGPAEAPTQQVEAPTQQAASPGQEQPTSRVAPVPQAEPTRRMDRPQGPPPAASPSTAERGGDGARRTVRRVTGFLATLLSIVGLVLALVLVAFVVMTLVGVNPENGVAQVVTAGADALVLRFRDLFLPADPGLALVVNYGVAALFWLVVGLVAARIVRALGRLV